MLMLSFAGGRGATGSESRSFHSSESRLVCLRVFFTVSGMGLLRYRLLVNFGDAVTVPPQEFCGFAAYHLQDGQSPWGCIAVPFRKVGTLQEREFTWLRTRSRSPCRSINTKKSFSDPKR